MPIGAPEPDSGAPKVATADRWSTKRAMPTIYRISVRGRLTERLAMALDGMTLSPGTVDSVFTGEVKDQSQLYGLLDRIRDLGLDLVSVQPQTSIDTPTDGEPSPA